MNIPAEPSDTLVVLAIRGETDADVRMMFGSFSDMILEVRFSKSRVPFPFVFVVDLIFLRRQKGGESSRKGFCSIPRCEYRNRSYGCLQGPKRERSCRVC